MFKPGRRMGSIMKRYLSQLAVQEILKAAHKMIPEVSTWRAVV
jgi:hypothetical protein